MEQKKLVALLFATALAGGAWWWSRRPAVAGATEGAGEGGVFAFLPEALRDFVAGAQDAAQGVVESITETVVDVVVPGAWSPPARAAPYLDAIYAAEDRAGAPRNLFARQIRQESDFNPDAVNARSGAKGLGQFMDATWAQWGRGDVFDPLANIDALGRYMRWLYDRHGSWRLALAAYNWGTGNLARKGVSAAPAETVAYMANIGGAVGLA